MALPETVGGYTLCPRKGGDVYGLSCYYGYYFAVCNRLHIHCKKEITALTTK